MERALSEGFTAGDRGALQVNWIAAVPSAMQVMLSLAAAGVGGGVLSTVAGSIVSLFGKKKEEDVMTDDPAKQAERIADILQRPVINRAAQHIVSTGQFDILFAEVVQSLGLTQRVYILVDDLDRYLPDSSLGNFEAIKLFLDTPQCAYIVAVDHAVIRRGLELRYPTRDIDELRTLPPIVSPDECIDRTIPLSIGLPMLADADGRHLLTVADPTRRGRSGNPSSPSSAPSPPPQGLRHHARRVAAGRSAPAQCRRPYASPRPTSRIATCSSDPP